MTAQVRLAFFVYFAEIRSLFLVKTNRYYHHYVNRLGDGPSSLPDVPEAEMFVFDTVNTDGTWRKRQIESNGKH
jgi:hypothetical protein